MVEGQGSTTKSKVTSHQMYKAKSFYLIVWPRPWSRWDETAWTCASNSYSTYPKIPLISPVLHACLLKRNPWGLGLPLLEEIHICTDLILRSQCVHK